MTLYSQGLTFQTWTKLYHNATIKKIITPQQAYIIQQEFKTLENTPLGQEIAPQQHPLNKFTSKFQVFTNKIIGKLPPVFSKPINYIFHPIKSIKSWIGKTIGKRIGIKIYKAFAKKITNKTARLIVKTLIRKGIKKASKFLIKLGLKASLHLAAESVNSIAPGVGLILDAVLTVGMFVIEKTVEKIYNTIQNIAESIWGEKIKARDIFAVPVAGLAGITSVLTSLGTATVAAASSAGTTIAISAFAGIFIYLTAFTIAPLLSTIAQLESASLSNGITSGCANTDNIFIYQCNPLWAYTFCNQCSTSDHCHICHSGCGTAAMTMILNAFGASANVVDIWHKQHAIGGYGYNEMNPPYTDCLTNNRESLSNFNRRQFKRR